MQRIFQGVTFVSLIVFTMAQAVGAQAQKKKPAKPAAAAVAPAPAIATNPVATAAPAAAEPQPEEKWYDSVKISGMIRVRPEVKENFNFDDSQRYNFVGQKLWLTAEKEFKDKSKIVITLQNVRV